MNARKSLFVAACVMASVFVFSSAQAFAETHKFSKVLLAPTGGFKSPCGVAVGVGGEVFVSNKESNVVDVYSSSGAFETGFTVRTGRRDPPSGGRLLQWHLYVAVGPAGVTSSGDDVLFTTTAQLVPRTPTGVMKTSGVCER